MRWVLVIILWATAFSLWFFRAPIVSLLIRMEAGCSAPVARPIADDHKMVIPFLRAADDGIDI